MDHPAAPALAFLRRHGVGRGDLVGLALAPGVGLGLALPGQGAEDGEDGDGEGRNRGGEAGAAPAGPVLPLAAEDPVAVVGVLDAEVRPRWVMWSAAETAGALVAGGVRVATGWDVAAIHRVLAGGWKADAGRAWARVHGLPAAGVPATGPLDLFSRGRGVGRGRRRAGPPGRPSQRHVGRRRLGGVTRHLARWAALALATARRQQRHLAALAAGEPTGDPALDRATGGPAGPDVALTVARAESAAELLCAELSADGLPVDRAAAEAIIAGFVGPRPPARPTRRRPACRPRRRGAAPRARRAPTSTCAAPARCKSLLRAVGIEVPDTRAWRLEAPRDAHPLVDALLAWRKAERIATTYGYGWLDEHLGADGRLRGAWTGSDGAAGRMTASAGLHNMPADLRGAVVAEPGHVFVRADLGQIEPRVLAAVSGDPALAAATVDDDLYAPVAGQLGVDRATAKVAVLGAMYGQTTGHGAQALRRLRRRRTRWRWPTSTTPTAPARSGRDLRTYGGRLIRMGVDRRHRARRARGPRPGRGPGPLRPQRPGAGRGGRAVQGVGGHGPGPARRRSAPGSCCACTTSCSSTPRRTTATAWPPLVDDLPPRGRPPLGPAATVRFVADISDHPPLVRRQALTHRHRRQRSGSGWAAVEDLLCGEGSRGVVGEAHGRAGLAVRAALQGHVEQAVAEAADVGDVAALGLRPARGRRRSARGAFSSPKNCVAALPGIWLCSPFGAWVANTRPEPVLAGLLTRARGC